MDIRRRVNVSKTSTDKYSWEVTVEITGTAAEWDTHIQNGDPWMAKEVLSTTTIATNEVKRQLEGGNA